ncbi:MAG: OmpA family protein [Burkholderiales bacterium]|nr:OmpA family protein [Burkholderiales bacterium]MDR4516576.1 OmpA family protein [Nitrosomonas sp.]
MKKIYSNNTVIALIIFPMLFSCAALQQEAHFVQTEQPELSTSDSSELAPSRPMNAQPEPPSKPASANYGRLIKFISTTDILFDFDSARLKPDTNKVLEYVAKELQSLQNVVELTGYADRIGPKSYNRNLSLRRAESVKIYLISKGIDPQEITTYGMGEENPVTGDTCDENLGRELLIECLSPDRRVEIEVKWEDQ